MQNQYATLQTNHSHCLLFRSYWKSEFHSVFVWLLIPVILLYVLFKHQRNACVLFLYFALPDTSILYQVKIVNGGQWVFYTLEVLLFWVFFAESSIYGTSSLVAMVLKLFTARTTYNIIEFPSVKFFDLPAAARTKSRPTLELTGSKSIYDRPNLDEIVCQMAVNQKNT